jgi:hypothetical protein
MLRTWLCVNSTGVLCIYNVGAIDFDYETFPPIYVQGHTHMGQVGFNVANEQSGSYITEEYENAMRCSVGVSDSEYRIPSDSRSMRDLIARTHDQQPHVCTHKTHAQHDLARTHE